MVAEYPNIMCYKIDGDVGKDLVAKYKIEAYPTFVFLKGGKQVDLLKGATEDTLRKMIERNMF